MMVAVSLPGSPELFVSKNFLKSWEKVVVGSKRGGEEGKGGEEGRRGEEEGKGGEEGRRGEEEEGRRGRKERRGGGKGRRGG